MKILRTRQKPDNPFGPQEISGLAYSLCTPAEKYFLDGVKELKSGLLMRAYACFQDALRVEPQFYDAHFLAAALLLCQGNLVTARSRFLTLISEHPTFFGVHIARFIPRFRLMIQVRDGFHIRVRPIAADISFAIGVLYLREGQLIEAKKALQTALNADFGLEPARVMLARALLEQGHYDEARKLIHSELPDLKSALGAVVMNILGYCHIGIGEDEVGLRYLDGAANFPFRGCQLYRDNLNIESARAYEQREYLEDALERLGAVKSGSLVYSENEAVEEAFYRLKNRIITMRKAGITKSLTISKPGKSESSRKETFWEFDQNGPKKKT